MRDRLKSDECSKYLRALADGDRLKIVQCLQDGPMSVGAVTRRLASRLANVSHHLRLLQQAGVVERRKEGRFVIYALSRKIHRPTPAGRGGPDALEFGCCRIELGQRKDQAAGGGADNAPRASSPSARRRAALPHR
jgi:ArsR family transcriptional regulator